MEGVQRIKIMLTLSELKTNLFIVIDSVQIDGQVYEHDLNKFGKYRVIKIYPYSTAVYNERLNTTQVINRLRVILEPPEHF